jgi:predicted GNAT superfamily acetyltransferase
MVTGHAVGSADRAGCSAARALARSAAGRARVEIRALGEIGELEQLSSLFAAVWRSPDAEAPIHSHVLRALELAGGYVAGAFDPGGEMIGGSVALPTLASPPVLHSHVTAVAGGSFGAGVGFALKLDQRAWALERGVSEVAWTFDPLVRRNAVFNLAKLGASVTGYLRNIYGPMPDVLNAGDESDRLLVSWCLDDDMVGRALASGERLSVAIDGAGTGPPRLQPGSAGEPVWLGTPGRVFRVQVPYDIEEMRHERPQVARDWRFALRDVLETLVRSGGDILGLDAEGDYVVRNFEGGET